MNEAHVCLKCGEQLEEGTKFCTKCGYPTEEQAQPVNEKETSKEENPDSIDNSDTVKITDEKKLIDKEFKKKWYLSIPFLIVTFFVCFPISLILTLIRTRSVKKQPKRYKIATWVMVIIQAIYFFLVVIVLFAGEEGDDAEQSSIYEESIEMGDEIYDNSTNGEFGVKKMSKNDDLSYWDTILTCTYPKKIKSKRDDILKYLEDIKGKDIKSCDAYLEIDKELFREDFYKQTLYDETYAYFGKLKDNRPDGKGVIVEEGIPVYAGSFKNGRFDGYGIYLDKYGIIEEGDFEEGLLNGEGIRYYSSTYKSGSEVIEDYYEQTEDIDEGKVLINYPVVSPSVGIVGTFSKELADGKKIKMYYSKYTIDNDLGETKDINYGILLYEGTMVKGKKNGKGKAYYPNGNLEYSGEWKNNDYHGKGTLYERDGAVKFKGEFKNGNIK